MGHGENCEKNKKAEKESPPEADLPMEEKFFHFSKPPYLDTVYCLSQDTEFVLLDQHKLFSLTEVARLKLVEIYSACHLLSLVIFAIPDKPVNTWSLETIY
jgi:hypothetical protein